MATLWKLGLRASSSLAECLNRQQQQDCHVAASTQKPIQPEFETQCHSGIPRVNGAWSDCLALTLCLTTEKIPLPSPDPAPKCLDFSNRGQDLAWIVSTFHPRHMDSHGYNSCIPNKGSIFQLSSKTNSLPNPVSAGPLEANLTCKMQGCEWVRESFWYCTASVIFSKGKYHHEPNIQHPKIWIRLLCLTTFWTTINLAQALALALRVVDAVLQANLTSHITMRSHLQGAKHIGCSQKSLPAWNDGTKHPSTTSNHIFISSVDFNFENNSSVWGIPIWTSRFNSSSKKGRNKESRFKPTIWGVCLFRHVWSLWPTDRLHPNFFLLCWCLLGSNKISTTLSCTSSGSDSSWESSS